MWSTLSIRLIKCLCMLVFGGIEMAKGSLSPSNAICAVAEYPSTSRSSVKFAGVVFPNGAGVTWNCSKSPLNLIVRQFSHRVFLANPKNVLVFAKKRRLVRIDKSGVKPVPLVTRWLQNTPTTT